MSFHHRRPSFENSEAYRMEVGQKPTCLSSKAAHFFRKHRHASTGCISCHSTIGALAMVIQWHKRWNSAKSRRASTAELLTYSANAETNQQDEFLVIPPSVPVLHKFSSLNDGISPKTDLPQQQSCLLILQTPRRIKRVSLVSYHHRHPDYENSVA